MGKIGFFIRIETNDLEKLKIFSEVNNLTYSESFRLLIRNIHKIFPELNSYLQKKEREELINNGGSNDRE